ncbi:MAG: LysR family transcriptional regulator [Gammaproteobacteria bacterium]|nr:LysR family transcriptional regulator [Gammaproteobacteria bacterium]
MDINTLHYFSVIAEKKSFQAASQLLAVPRSTLSRKIAELETALGIQLLNRTTRQVSLTETGMLIYQQCQRMDDVYESIMAVAQNSSSMPKGVLRVSVPVTLGRLVFARWMVAFNKQYPHITLDICLSDSYENLVENQIDVAIRVGDLKSSSLVCKKIGMTPRWLVCSQAFARQHKPEETRQLNELPLISLKTDQIPGDRWRLSRKGRTELYDIKPAIQVNDMMTLLEIVREGAGIGMIPYFVAKPYLSPNELTRIMPEYEGELATFHLIYQKRDNMPRKIRVFIEFISQAMRDEASLQTG